MKLFSPGKLRFSTKFTFILTLIISVLVIAETQKQYNSYKRERCRLLGQTAAYMFQSEINSYIAVNDIIESMILETSGNLSNFDQVARNLTSRLPALYSLQLAPKGVVTKVFPLSAYEGIGENLFNMSDTKISSSYSLKTKKPYLTGPLTLQKGIRVIMIQHPVFLPDTNGNEKFWGFSIIMLDCKTLFSKQALEFLDSQEYSWCLWKPDPQTEEIYTLAGNTDIRNIKKPCEAIFGVTNSLWTLYTAPADGWVNWQLLAIEELLALAVCISLALISNFLFTVRNKDAELENLSYRDTLTSLYNARKFMEMLREFQKHQKPYALIYMDLNDFKQINDTLGHETGDEVLIITGRKLSNCLREDDRAFRIGGDEFTVILPGDYEPKFVEIVINRIKESINRESVLKNTRLKITASAGFALYPTDGSDYEEIIKIADNGMYEDKRKIKEAKQKELEELKK
ncbi:MAG: sensor domain-containing diguanylate cyclase [Treponema sp.]|nr:sensor domain-containing diguanylate cyclase [Treponema sp.]